MKVGKAKYGGGKKSFKIENGDNIYRVLPPLGKLADTGKWYEYYRVEWGYKNSQGRNRPFQDVRKINFKTKMVEVESAAHLRREALKKQKEDVVAAFKAGNATKEQVEEAVDLVKQYNLDAKYYLNAVNLQGEIGLLKLNSSMMKALRAEIDKLTKQGRDPLSVKDGLFFNFSRSNETGKLQDWVFGVVPYQKDVEAVVNGQTMVVKQEVTHTMDEAFIGRLGSEAFELSDMYPEITAEQVERLVKEGVPAVDEILGVNEENTQTTQATETVSEATPTAVPVTENVSPTNIVSQTTAAAPAALVTTEAAPAAGTAMSDDDFLASIGANS